jgi:hypothetical protein
MKARIEHDGDPRHMAAQAAMTPAERLDRAFDWIEFANEIRGIARRQEDGRCKPTPTPSGSAGRSSRAS